MDTVSQSASGLELNLRAGDWVEVRAADEILATLDAQQSVEGLPFMPEMLKYCGKRFRVSKTAHKTCDTVRDYNIRRMERTVHLEGLRCDGSAHEGCQAACLVYWKHAWLRKVEGPQSDQSHRPPDHQRQWMFLQPSTRVATAPDSAAGFRCQATDLLKFTTPVRRRERFNPRFYLKDLTSGNVGLAEFTRYGLFATFNAFVARWFKLRYPRVTPRGTGRTTPGNLNLQPGDKVVVRSKEAIMETLGPSSKNRGLFFDVEMVPHCGRGPYTVLSRVETLVDEKTGRLLKLQNPCIILDGVACTGHFASARMFCPRAIYPYWREAWLERVEASESDTSARRS
jgi:hypothetical protein